MTWEDVAIVLVVAVAAVGLYIVVDTMVFALSRLRDERHARRQMRRLVDELHADMDQFGGQS